MRLFLHHGCRSTFDRGDDCENADSCMGIAENGRTAVTDGTFSTSRGERIPAGLDSKGHGNRVSRQVPKRNKVIRNQVK